MRMHRGKILMAAVVLVLAAVFVLEDSAVRLYVRVNHEALEAFASAALADSGEEGKSLRYGPWAVTCWREAGMVEFHLRRGAAFGGEEKGFYYSAGDVPDSFQGTGYPLTEERGGVWRWEDPWGNHGETERILPRWFWFRAVL